MRYVHLILGTLSTVVVLGVACSSANFGASTTTPSKNDQSKAGPNSTTTDPNKKDKDPGNIEDKGINPPSKCNKDQVAPALTSPQEDCIVKQGKTWNFNKGECGNMPASTFQCDWQTVLAELGKFKPTLVTPTLAKSATDGSKLVTCGQSIKTNPGGGRYLKFAVQFVSASAGAADVECVGTPASSLGITTGCYIFAEDAPTITIPAAGTKDYDDYVYKCINEL